MDIKKTSHLKTDKQLTTLYNEDFKIITCTDHMAYNSRLITLIIHYLFITLYYILPIEWWMQLKLQQKSIYHTTNYEITTNLSIVSKVFILKTLPEVWINCQGSSDNNQ